MSELRKEKTVEPAGDEQVHEGRDLKEVASF
jgi:hypothetical protein